MSSLKPCKVFQFQYGAIRSITPGHPKCGIRPFQFQYGAIRREAFSIYTPMIKGFQFQYGAIRSLVEIDEHIHIVDFNSNMVRLGGERYEEIIEMERNFNSNMVRLGAVCFIDLRCSLSFIFPRFQRTY